MTNEFNLNKKYNWELAHKLIPTVYKAKLTQSAASDPVPTVFENNLNASISWTRINTGEYIGTLVGGVFVAANTYILVQTGYNSNPYFAFAEVDNNGAIHLLFEDATANPDDIAGEAFIEIQVFK